MADSVFDRHIIFNIISNLFLLVTYLVYKCIACIKKLENIHRKCLRYYIGTQLIFYSSLNINNIGKTWGWFSLDEHILLVYITQYFVVSSFFWLNVSCYDLYRTFRERQLISQHFPESKRFTYYSIYAWGFPFLISIFTFCMDLSYNVNDTNEFKQFFPGIREQKYWFGSDLSQALYMTSPIIIIIIINLYLFIRAMKLLSNQREDSTISNICNRRNDNSNKKKFIQLSNLSIVMGLSWFAGDIVLILKKFCTDIDWIIVIFQFFNDLQGLFIFLIFLCKKRIFNWINKLFFGSQLTPQIV